MWDLLCTKLLVLCLQEQLEGRGPQWPNITPFRSSDLGSLQSESNRYYFLIFEHADSSLGTELILDFSVAEQVEIRTVLSDNEVLARSFGVILFPAVVYIPQGRSDYETLRPDETTREGFRKSIRAFLSAKDIPLPAEIPVPDINQPDAPNLAELMRLNHVQKKLKQIKAEGDVVFLADMETALKYMLQHEIPNRKIITGESLKALKNFLNVVAKYFPAGETGIKYFETIKRNVDAVDGELRGLRWVLLFFLVKN